MTKHIVHPAGYQALHQIVNISKYGSENRKQAILQFLYHRKRLYASLFEHLIQSDDPDLIEPISDLFIDLLVNCSRIWDGSYFIEKVVLEPASVKRLLDKIIAAKVGEPLQGPSSAPVPGQASNRHD